MCVGLGEKEGWGAESVDVCVCVCERERERERECVCCVCVCVCVWREAGRKKTQRMGDFTEVSVDGGYFVL